jgi:hypothetical protein
MIDTLTALGFCRDMLLNSDAGGKDQLPEKEIAFNAGHAWAGDMYLTLFVDRGFES